MSSFWFISHNVGMKDGGPLKRKSNYVKSIAGFIRARRPSMYLCQEIQKRASHAVINNIRNRGYKLLRVEDTTDKWDCGLAIFYDPMQVEMPTEGIICRNRILIVPGVHLKQLDITMNIINLHVTIQREELRIKQLDTCLRWIGENDKGNTIIAGDFNGAAPAEITKDHVINSGFYMMTLYHEWALSCNDRSETTTVSGVQGAAIDYILSTADLFDIYVDRELMSFIGEDLNHYPIVAVMKGEPRPVSTISGADPL